MAPIYELQPHSTVNMMPGTCNKMRVFMLNSAETPFMILKHNYLEQDTLCFLQAARLEKLDSKLWGHAC